MSAYSNIRLQLICQRRHTRLRAIKSSRRQITWHFNNFCVTNWYIERINFSPVQLNFLVVCFERDISHCIVLLYWVDREHPCRRVSRCIVFIAHNSINHRSNIMAIYYAKWQRKHKMKYISTNIHQTLTTHKKSKTSRKSSCQIIFSNTFFGQEFVKPGMTFVS